METFRSLCPRPSILRNNMRAFKRVALLLSGTSIGVLTLLLALVCSVAATSQNTFVTGTDSSHAGWQIAAFVPSDYISGKRELVAETMIAQNGSFTLAMDIKQTSEVYLVVLHIQANLYVEPGHTYAIALPAESKRDFRKLDKTEIYPDLSALPENDLNVLIKNFNKDYYTFVNEHYYDYAIDEFKGNPEFIKRVSKNTKADIYIKSSESDSLKQKTLSNFSELVTHFEASMHKKYSAHYGNAFFKDYVTYSLAEIELVAGLHRHVFYKQYFMSQPLQLKNPAYMRVFKIFYNNLFTSQTKLKNESIVKIVNTEQDPAKLQEVLADDSCLTNTEVRNLAMIYGLKELYFNQEFSYKAVEKTLEALGKTTTAKPQQTIAINTVEQLRKNKEGWPQPDFALLDEREEKWHLAENDGLPMYIIFFASWNHASLKEMMLLEKLAETYQKDIRIVAINMDEKVDDFKKYLQAHSKQKFTFLYGYGDVMLKENFALKAMPRAVMLGPDLKVKYTFTPLPSQGLDAVFAKIKQQAAAGGQGPKTWNKK